VKLVTLRGTEKLLDIAKVLSGDEDDKEESGEGGDEEAVDAGDCDGAESPPEAAESDPSSEEE
jgi:hypothetical protein